MATGRTKKIEPGHIVVTDEAALEVNLMEMEENQEQTAIGDDTAPENQIPSTDYEQPGTSSGADGSESTSPAPPVGAVGDVKPSEDTEVGKDEKAPENETEAPCECVVLKDGTYGIRGEIIKAGIQTYVDPELAVRLLNTGFFERG